MGQYILGLSHMLIPSFLIVHNIYIYIFIYLFIYLSLCQEDHNDNDQFIILGATVKAKKITSLT